jgi:glycosyltransferase involved in cell wall biosynthesis
MRDVLARARVVVYPSHYEGFGLPVVDALALGKPVIVLESAVNRELAGLLDDPNLHPIASLHQLNEAVELAYKQTAERPKKAPRRWRAAGEEYVSAWRELLARDIDVPKLRARFATVRMIQSVGG